MAPSTVAFDGWSLAYAPFSPAAIHLLTLISDDTTPDHFLVLLPGPTLHPLPERVKGGISFELAPTPSRLAWEQVRLPRLAAQRGASALHLLAATPPFLTRIPITCSPTQWNSGAARPAGPAADRLRRSLAAAGMDNIRRLDWPSDLPVPQTSLPVQLQAPRAHPLFLAETPALPMPAGYPVVQQPGQQAVDLTTAPFFLYAGPSDPGTLRLLLAGWSWASPALGEDFKLVLPDLPGAALQWINDLAAGEAFSATLVSVQSAALPGLAWLYRQAAAVIHLSPSQPWGDPVILALAAARPLIALDEPLTAARTGPAAFLIPDQDPRLLGAALVTLGSDDTLAQALTDAARQRSSHWLLES